MNTKRMNGATFDLRGAFYDFDQAFREDPDTALGEFQALLLDERACRDRIAFLTALQLSQEGEERSISADEFAEEIRLIREGRTYAGFHSGKLLPERICRLASNPDALWQAHRALVAGIVEPLDPPDHSVRLDSPTPTFCSPDVETPIVGQTTETTPDFKSDVIHAVEHMLLKIENCESVVPEIAMLKRSLEVVRNSSTVDLHTLSDLVVRLRKILAVLH